MYDLNKNGRLGIAEFVLLLRDNGIVSDYPKACRILARFATGGIDWDSFLGLLASSIWEPETSEETVAIFQCVFNSYDASHSGTLDASEYLKLLADHASEIAGDPLASHRQGQTAFPIGFDRFLVLMRQLFESGPAKDMGASIDNVAAVA